MANTPYPNYVLENKFEDQHDTYLDLLGFCTVDTSLTGGPGFKKVIRTYSATTNKTQTLAQGEGNTEQIEAGYSDVEYETELLQNRFIYFDEEAMKDPLVVDTGLNHQAVDMFNTEQAKAIAEFAKAEQEVTVSAFNFDAFVDATAKIDALEIRESVNKDAFSLFALVNPDDLGEIRKNLKAEDGLQYVTDYATNGYIGTVASVNIFTSALVPAGTIYVATPQAVTYFTKKGTEVEQEREPNIRKNEVYLRKYGIFALTNQNYIVKMTKGA